MLFGFVIVSLLLDRDIKGRFEGTVPGVAEVGNADLSVGGIFFDADKDIGGIDTVKYFHGAVLRGILQVRNTLALIRYILDKREGKSFKEGFV